MNLNVLNAMKSINHHHHNHTTQQRRKSTMMKSTMKSTKLKEFYLNEVSYDPSMETLFIGTHNSSGYEVSGVINLDEVIETLREYLQDYCID